VLRARIKRITEAFTEPNGDLRLIQIGPGSDVVIEGPNEEQQALIAALDGKHSLEELEERFGAGEVGETIAQLRELGIVEDAADDDLIPPAERQRFDRQLRYFSAVGEGGTTPSQCQERLRDASVALIGVGGLGGWSALALAASGVGEIRMVDGDRIEESNLNRQVLYTEAEIGLLKVEAAARRLRAFNPAMLVTATARRLESQAELADFIAGADVVVDTADWPAYEIERWCNSACFEAGIPYIAMTHFASTARVGPLYVPGRTGCFSCQEIAYRRQYPLFDEVTGRGENSSAEAATLGAACGLIGGQVGMEVMHLLTGVVEPATLGVSHIYDLRTMEVEREVVVPEPECPVCSHLQPQTGGDRLEGVAGG
jgi:bacteriocin biosynthesis cyclodehydratase domain-containing protein